MISFGKSSVVLFAASKTLVDGRVLPKNLDAQKFAKELSSDVYALTNGLKKTVGAQKGSEFEGHRASAIVEKGKKGKKSKEGQKGKEGRKSSDEEASPDEVEDLTSFIQGTYAFVMEDGNHRGTHSGIGLIHYDGEGKFSGNLSVNVPDPDSPPPQTPGHARRVFTTPVQGYYTPDEVEGIFDEHLECTDTPLGFLEFDVRLAETQGSSAINVLRSHLEPSPFVPSSLITYKMIPRPGMGFNDASLLGRYSVSLLLAGNPDVDQGHGHVMFYGDGNYDGVVLSNPPGDEESRGPSGPGQLEGSYSVNDDGTGFLQLTLDSGFSLGSTDFLILQHDELHAHHVRMQIQEPFPLVNNLAIIDLIFLGP